MTAPSDDDMDLLIGYALDALAPDEAERVSRLLEERPELRETVAELRATLDKLPYALPDPDVPPDLRARVMAGATGGAAPPTPAKDERRSGRWRRLTLFLGGLSAALAVVAAVLWGQLGAAQRELAAARVELQRSLAEREQIVRVISSYETVAQLAGAGGSGAVLRTPGGDTLVAVRLPPLAPGRVYQLWLIEGEGAPVSGGTFEVDASGYGVVALAAGQAARAADVFAITDEPGPDGSPGPTSAPLVVSS